MTIFHKKSIIPLVLVFTLLVSCFGWLGTIKVSAASQVALLEIAVAHLEERVSELEAAVETNADIETINTKIAELEEAIAAAETTAKAYADTQDAILKNELTATIESAKQELDVAIKKKADAEAVNAKMAELEEAIIAAETIAKAYTDTQNATLRKELTAAIELAKAGLVDTNNTQTDVTTINARITALEVTAAAVTNELNGLTQKTEALEKNNDDLQTMLIIVCVISGVTFGGCSAFVIWFFVDRKKKLLDSRA